jgi:hypothetical protein
VTQLIARFAVDGWDARTIDGVTGADEGDWVGVARMHKTFRSGLVGTSTVLFVSSGATEGQRSYLAAERITATVGGDGEQGGVTVHHGGLESSPDTWFGHVVPGSGTGPMADWAGSAHIEHDDEGAFFVFELG